MRTETERIKKIYFDSSEKKKVMKKIRNLESKGWDRKIIQSFVTGGNIAVLEKNSNKTKEYH